MTPHDVVLIHGAWLTSASWDPFRRRYEAQGLHCLTPEWPLQDRPIEDLRRSPHPALGRLTIPDIVRHHERLIRALPAPPVLIGHSFGGLFVQLLLDRGLGAAGVAIDPAPARGVFPGLATIWAALPVFLAWQAWRRPATMNFGHFARSFMQRSSADEQRAAYESQIVPTPGRIYFDLALGLGNRVDFTNPRRAPLLLIAGDQDRTVQLSAVQAAYRRHHRSRALTEIKVFTGRTHWLIAAPGWEEVADYALAWASENARKN
ncbi:MAG TPA: alpha/beta hydrolase [Candidatus Udaeobacter sp.]|nr:alpha/beta hydrolase [Candidatus Udaeobacter sp.]